MSSRSLFPPNYEVLAARLEDLREALANRPTLSPGMRVRWKRGLCQSPHMSASGHAVVLQCLATPHLARDADPNSGEYLLPLDTELATMDDAGVLLTFWTCANYLETSGDVNSRVADLLQSTTALLLRPQPLKPGIPVVWKPHCATPEIERPEQPGVLIELLEAEETATLPVRSCEPNFRQPINACVAVDDPAIEFRLMWTDRRRLAPYTGPVERTPETLAAKSTSPSRQSAQEAIAATAGRMLARHARLQQVHDLPPGTLVTWKPGLRDRSIPLDGDAAVVMKPLDPPRFDPKAAVGSSIWRQPLSIALGCMGDDGHFIVVHYDARKFEPLGSRDTEHRHFLEQAYASYSQPHALTPGDLVQWKPGLINRSLPEETSLAVVIEVLSPPIFSEHIECTSPYFREPLNLVIGIRDEEVFELLHIDGNRVRPAAGDADPDEGDWLRSRMTDLMMPSTFQPGTMAEWKENLCSMPDLEPEDRGIVIEVLEAPVYAEEHSSGSPFFRIPHTLVVGFPDADEDMLLRHVDARRLRPALPDPLRDETPLQAYLHFSTPRHFDPGHIVVWAPGLEDESFIDLSPESPGIVLQRIHPPLRSPRKNLLAADFGARADLLIGGMNAEGDFSVVYADSRRLQRHTTHRDDVARRLRGFRRRLRRVHNLCPGRLVAWKDRLCSHPGMPDGIPGIILELRDAPARFPDHQEVEFWSPLYAATWDAVVGVWMDDRMMRIHCDIRHLEPFDADIHGEILQRRATEEAQRLDEFARMLDDFDDDDPPF